VYLVASRSASEKVYGKETRRQTKCAEDEGAVMDQSGLRMGALGRFGDADMNGRKSFLAIAHFWIRAMLLAILASALGCGGGKSQERAASQTSQALAVSLTPDQSRILGFENA
jgi:hypothetical protein